MLEFIKNIEPDFNIAEIPLKTEKLKLDNKSHYENAAIKGLEGLLALKIKFGMKTCHEM